jgi:hypothetical protein
MLIKAMDALVSQTNSFLLLLRLNFYKPYQFPFALQTVILTIEVTNIQQVAE